MQASIDSSGLKCMLLLHMHYDHFSPTSTGKIMQRLHALSPVCQSTATNFLSMPYPIPSRSLQQTHRYLLIAALLMTGASLPGSMLVVTET